jgi:8-oxo-dGTP pyrophosphatase MutT (NUDIX family)
VSEQNEVLLIRAFVSHGRWTLPGGGLKRHETAVAAARRELQEETGITADEADFVHLATLSKPDFKIPFTAPLFRLRVLHSALPKELVNPREIAAIDWFKRDRLPASLSLIATVALDLDDNFEQG